MTLTEKLVNILIRAITGTVCKVNTSQLNRVPMQGPLIMACNHVNFLEAPILYTRLQPRPVTGFSKIESWDKWWMAKLFDLWDIIPIKRFTADSQAIRRGLAALEQNVFLAVAPEGTRSGNGVMQQAYPGVVLMALHSGAPIQPVAFHGAENFWDNMKKLRRTEFNIEVGRPFYVKPNSEKPDRNVRARILDEIMYQIAALLPEQYRGVYTDLSKATDTYLEFLPDSVNFA
ncbi:MAG: 1-acyl-sn-glycerol-3-phosphate acyltransferase [Anaerolineales bacterium]|nr:1-acyl-sn-glycerol-3-phosphate acyltransferase [Anaerolineales bacterium]